MFILLKISYFPLLLIRIWENKPNPGRIKIYTSGCPKNQNMCWYIIGFPLLIGLKNDVLIFESKRIIVIALVRIGNDIIRRIDVIKIDHINNVMFFIVFLFGFMFMIDLIKFIDLIIDDSPFRCKEKMM